MLDESIGSGTGSTQSGSSKKLIGLKQVVQLSGYGWRFFLSL